MRKPIMALRPKHDDPEQMDDVVIENAKMVRMEMMSDKSLWMACYFDDDSQVSFWVHVHKGKLMFSVTETPDEYIDWDEQRRNK